jgi:ABC-2 type transport system permease protein
MRSFIASLKLRRYIIKGMLAKEFAQLFRDKRMRMMIFVAPILMLILFGYAATTDVTNVKLSLLDDDKSFESRALTEKIFASNHFHLFASAENLKRAEEILQSGESEAVIHIPEGFGKYIDRKQPLSVQCILDGTDPNRSMIIYQQMYAILSMYSEDISVRRTIVTRGESAQPAQVSAIPRIFFNEDLASKLYFLPALLGLITTLIMIMLTSMAIVKEKESGNIEQIIVSPIRPGEYIAGKTIPFAIVSMIDMTVIMLIIMLWFNVPLRGSFLLIMFSAALYTIACLGVGIFISTISGTQQQAMLSTFIFLLPSMLLSGFIFPIASMPEPVQIITYLNPMRYFLTICREIFLKGTGIINLWDQLLGLLVLGFLFLGLSIRKFMKEF